MTAWSDQVFRYCERAQDPSFWAEPLNAVSNVAFLAVAGVVLGKLARPSRGSAVGHPVLVALLAVLVAAIGVGSFLFHTFATRWARTADVAPIGVFMVAYLVLALRAFLGWSWPAVVLGVAVFGVWMLLEPAGQDRPTGVAEGLAQLPAGLAGVWVGFRVLGAVLTVPIAEELAFRGYVLPKLVAYEFDTVRPGYFTWGACLVSSLLFGVLHGRWLAGTLAGVGYALALRRRGQLADAIVAHMTTNTLLAATVFSQGAWFLWV